MKKRILSLVLAVSLLLCLLPTVVMAAEKITVTKTDIAADSVINYDGYASVEKESGFEHYVYSFVDRQGNVLQSYTAGSYSTTKYIYSEGFLSINSSAHGFTYEDYSSYYYNLDGTVALEVEFNEEVYREIAEEYGEVKDLEITRECSLKPFQDGVAFVRDWYNAYGSDGYVGTYMYAYLINTKGEIIYTFPEAFNRELAWSGGFYYSGGAGWSGEGLIGISLLSKDCEFGSEATYEIFGYIDYSGNMVLDLLDREYSSSYPFYNGRAQVVSKDGLRGYIDKSGTEVIPLQYENAGNFADGLARVKKNGKWGAIDTEGKEIIPFIYDGCYGTGEGYIAVGLDGKYGLVDTNNQVIVPLEYDDISTVKDGVAYGIKDGLLYIIEIASTTPDPVENPFNDVKESDYYYDPILWAVENGITNGTGKYKFSPENPCTRGQIVTFLWRACGSPNPTTTENPFTDIASNAYYYKAVLWAVENGITTGTGKGKFSPEATCTRGQVATFLWRAQGKPAPTSSDNPFNDVNSDTYYYNAILWAVEKGVTNGTGKGKFSPDNSCTRGQIVTFLYRALK